LAISRWGAHCSTSFGSGGGGPAVHEISLTVEEAGVSGRPGGLYVGVVDAGWDWRSHSTSLYQVPDCYSYKANSRHREGALPFFFAPFFSLLILFCCSILLFAPLLFEGIVYAHRAPRFRAPRFGTGDVVKMVVDFDKSTISFVLNDVLVKCCSHIDKLPASLRVVVAFANEQQRIRISRIGDDTESLAALCGDSSDDNDIMSLFFIPSALQAASAADAEAVAAAVAMNGGAALAATRRLAVWSRWADIVDAPTVSPFVETGMDGSGGAPNQVPVRTPSGVVSSPREPSDSALAAAAVFGSACGSGAARARAPMRAHVDDLGWESAAEVHAMRELAAALRSRGGGTWAAPTPERIDELYMESIDKVWDWGQGAPTFDSMRVSPAIEVGPFAADDEMHPLVEVRYSHSFVCAIFCLCLLTILLFALSILSLVCFQPIVRLLAGRVATPVEGWVDHSCLVVVAVPELGTSVTVRIAAAHLLPLESQPYVFERGRAAPDALGASDSVARAALRLDHEVRGAAASMALGALVEMLRLPRGGDAGTASRASAPHRGGGAAAFSVAQIGGAAAMHCVVRQMLLGADHVTTACAIVERVLALDARATAPESFAADGDAVAMGAAAGDSARALLRRALWSGALYGDAAIAVPSPVGFAIVQVSVLVCTVIFYANLAHSLTRSP
jgi:hypothetical protein